MELNTRLLRKTLVETLNQRTTTCEVYTILHNIGVELRRHLLQHLHQRCIELHERLVEGVGNLVVGEGDGLWQGGEHTWTRNHEILRLILQLRYRSTNLTLYLLGSTLTDADAVLLTHIVHDVGRKYITRNIYRLRAYDTAQRDTGYLGGTATYVDNHITLGSLYIYTCTESSSHRLVNHRHLTTSGMLGRVTHGANFDICRTRRDADNHLERRREERASGLNLAYHTTQH